LLRSAFIRSDNDPEFIAKSLKRWLAACRVNTPYIELGPPWENAQSETFVSRLGDELLRGSFAKRDFGASGGRRNRMQPSLLADARRPSCPHRPTPPTSPTKSGRSSNPVALLGRKPRPSAEVAALRHVADAVFYLLRSGCSWRMVPKESTRPGKRSTTNSANGG
jgi:hypothetical protein